MTANRFKFRFWDKTKKEMIYDVQNAYDTMDNVPYDSFGDVICMHEDGEGVLMQSTGLTDAKNVEIFEGDILDFDLSNPKNGGHYIGFIEWIQQNDFIGWYIRDMEKQGAWFLSQIAHPNDWMVWGNVIGNIYENPELIKE